MSPRPDPSRSATALLAAALSLAPATGRPQTIADYGRAQRALLEATMAQTAARAAAISASSPAAPASVAAGASPALANAATGPAGLPTRGPGPARAEPSLAVSGVFSSPRAAWAEIVVDGRAWRLSRGDDVPGTAWRVAAVSADEVRLDRVVAGSAGRSAVPRQRRFVLGSGR